MPGATTSFLKPHGSGERMFPREDPAVKGGRPTFSAGPGGRGGMGNALGPYPPGFDRFCARGWRGRLGEGDGAAPK